MTEDATATPVELVTRWGNREVLGVEDFTETDLEAIRRAKPSEESKAFNHELKVPQNRNC
jgi:hypothetical protein